MTTTGPAAVRTVAFLGLGHMGGPMAANLAAAGHAVRGFDVVPEALDRARLRGITPAPTIVDAVRGADVVVTMLPSGRHLLDAYRGPGGVLQAVAGDRSADGSGFRAPTLVDCSTVAVDDARAAHALAADAGLAAVDAPVSGGTVGAEAGTLTFMVGGDHDAVARVGPLLEVMGGRTVHCGDSGAGQAAKVCNNMLLAVSMIGTSEAFALGERLGLDPQALFDVASASSGQCWALSTNCPVAGPVPASPANRDYEPGFAVALMRKDLQLARQAIRTTGTTCDFGLLACETYEELADSGAADRDFSVVLRRIEERSGEPVAAALPGAAR